jgi:outer membrane protein
MKNNKISLIISIVALVGILMLFVDKLSNNDGDSNEGNQTTQISSDFKIAFVNVDTAMESYDLYNVLSLQLMQKQQDLENQLQSKMLSLQNRANQLQQQYGQHLITTQAYQEKGQNLSNEQIMLQQWQEEKMYELQEDQMLMLNQVSDSVMSVINEINKNKKYDYIINNTAGSTLLYGNEDFNITDEVIVLLNKKYNNNAVIDTTLTQ